PVVVAIATGNIVNFVVDYGFVFGKFGLPQIGLPGLAIATMGSRIAMFVLLCWLGWDLFQACIPDLRAELVIIRRDTVWRLLRIGLPVGLQVGMEVWAFTGTTLLMGQLGETAIAAHMVTLNLASLSFMVPFGVSAAAATRVGNRLGAG